MFAAHEKLANLVAIVDHNGLQIDGACTEVMCLGSVASKFAAFDWHVLEIDGHDLAAIREALLAAKAYPDGPAMIVAHTIKGKGVSFMEGEAGWHGKAPSAEQVTTALAELDALTERSDS